MKPRLLRVLLLEIDGDRRGYVDDAGRVVGHEHVLRLAADEVHFKRGVGSATDILGIESELVAASVAERLNDQFAVHEDGTITDVRREGVNLAAEVGHDRLPPHEITGERVIDRVTPAERLNRDAGNAREHGESRP